MNNDYTHQCHYCCHCSSSVDHRCSCSLSKDNIQSVERGNRKRTSRQQRQRGLPTRRKKGIIEYFGTSQVYFLLGNICRECSSTTTHGLCIGVLKHKTKTHDVLCPVYCSANYMQHWPVTSVHIHTVGFSLFVHFVNAGCTRFEDILKPIASTPFTWK